MCLDAAAGKLDAEQYEQAVGYAASYTVTMGFPTGSLKGTGGSNVKNRCLRAP